MKKILVLIQTIILCCSFVLSFYSIESYAQTDEKKWTLMIYLGADNDLDEFSDLDLEEIKSAGESENVNIVVLVDHWNDEGSSYQVLQGNEMKVKEELEEVNTGDPDTLQNFVNWAKTNYPAEKYGLVLWNHGGGFKAKEKEIYENKDICWDETSDGDALTISEIVEGLKNQYVDLLGFDACLMNQVEIAYELRNNAGVLVASEETIPSEGWEYNKIINYMNDNPYADEKELSSIIIDSYVESYEDEKGITLSAIDLTKVEPLVEKINNLSQILSGLLLERWDEIHSAVKNTQYYEYSDYKDLYHFTVLLDEYVKDNQNLTNATQDVRNAFNQAVIKNRYSQDCLNSYGLTIWLPSSFSLRIQDEYDDFYEVEEYLDQIDKYGELYFVGQTEWDSFLSKYMDEAKLKVNDVNFQEAINDVILENDMNPNDSIYVPHIMSIDTFFGDNYGIQDLLGIQAFVELSTLSLTNNHIYDISMLNNVGNLRVLWLSNNEIENIEALTNLTSLKYLDLRNNNIRDIYPLYNLPNLKRIELTNNPINVMSDSKNSAVIRLMEARGTAVEYDKSYEQVEYKDFKSKKDLDRKKIFTIKMNFSVDETCIDDNIFVIKEDGSYVPDTFIERGASKREIIVNPPQRGYDREENYYLVINKALKSTTGKMMNKTVRLPFSTLEKNENEEEIKFEDKNLEQAIKSHLNIPLDKPIYTGDAEGVTFLSLEEKNISNIEGLQYFTDLEDLSLWINNIEDVTPLENLTNLRSLDLDDNNIGDIAPIANLTGLEYLYISGNPIIDYSPLDCLENTNIYKKYKIRNFN